MPQWGEEMEKVMLEGGLSLSLAPSCADLVQGEMRKMCQGVTNEADTS